ncbi:MAG: O-antigen ligase family protein [Pseudomonadota bacterium]
MPTPPASPQEAARGLATALPGDRLRNAATLIGLVFLGLGTMLSPAAIYLGLVVLLAVGLSEGHGFLRFLRGSPWVWLAIAVTAYTLLRTLLAQQAFPEQAEVIGKYGGQLMVVAGIPALLLGWQLARRPRWLVVLLAGLVVSLVVFFFQEAGWSTLMKYLQGEDWRLQFGGHKNAIGGLYGAGVLAGLYLLYRCLADSAWLNGSGWRRLVRYGLGLLLVGAVVLFTLVVLWNQSRTAWLGLAAAVLPALLYLSFQSWKREGRTLSWGPATVVSLVVIAAMAMLVSSELVDKRFQQIANEVEHIEDIRVDQRGGGSLGTRTRISLAASEAIGERPLVGWGPDYFDEAMAAAGAEDLQRWAHFHNFYLQLAVGLGLLGLLGFLALYLLPLWYLRSSKGGDALPVSMRLFAVSLWVYVMVLGLATIRHDDPAGQALYVMALGVAAMGLGVRYRGRLGG